jgi:TPR repeat protein
VVWRLAVAQGHALSQYALGGPVGGLYANGEDVAQNYAESVRLWRLAATQDNADSLYNIGQAYSKLKTCAQCKVARFGGAECARRAWPFLKPS